MILLTGATGKTGGATAKALAEKNVKLRALVRDKQKASPLAQAGIELVVGDLADEQSVAKALKGVDKALLIAPNSDQQLHLENHFIDCAQKSGLRHIVKLSSMEAVPGATGAIPNIHVQSEAHIKASQMAWTMIRPNFFMQNLLTSAGTIKDQGKIFLPMKDGKTGMADIRDVAAIMAESLTGEDHKNKSYDITGPELLSFSQVAAHFSEVMDTKIEYVDMPLDAYISTIAPFLLNEWHVNAITELFAEIAAGGLENITNTAAQILGREPISLNQFIQDHMAAFKGA